MRPYKNLENKIPWDTFSRIRLVCIKVQVDNSSEPPDEYNCLWQIKVVYDLLNQVRSYMNIMQFQISFRVKNRWYLSHQDMIS